MTQRAAAAQIWMPTVWLAETTLRSAAV